MKTNLFLLLLTAALTWRPASPGYHFSFPRDHFSHPQFQTEWWYFTGNLRASDGHRFGYELTFFRQANHVDPALLTTPKWKPDEIYLAHLALTDIDGKRFFHTERLNRTGPGLAGASQQDSRYWNGNWQVRWLDPGANNRMRLEAICDQLKLELSLDPEKPPVIHGRNGVSRKGPKPGESSHYISFTRIQSQGQLTWEGKRLEVTGFSWMDHEFFTEPPDNGLVGWDWFSIQLSNNTEVMLYRLRHNEGPSFSSGTFVDDKGKARFLDEAQFTLTPQRSWKSKQTNVIYPIAWHISIPSLKLELNVKTPLPTQELVEKNSISPTYWEGVVDYEGSSVKGSGYLEMTGYAGRVRLGS